jgi:hypothetical protein
MRFRGVRGLLDLGGKVGCVDDDPNMSEAEALRNVAAVLASL